MSINQSRLDEAATIFFTKELEALEAFVYQIDFPMLKFANGDIFDIDTSDDPGATTTAYQQMEQIGQHKIVANNGKDLPRSTVRGEEFIQNVVTVGGSYGFTLQDIRSAQFANKPLDSMLTAADREANMQAINRLGAFGDDDHNVLGLFNHPDIPTASVVNPGGGTEWVNKTPAEILVDMTTCTSQIVENTLQVIAPNRLLLPIEQYNLIANTDAGVGTGQTILSFFLASNPFIDEIDLVNELDGAGTAGVDVMVVYAKNSLNAKYKMPMPYTVHPPQEQGLEMVISSETRWGGLTVYKPLSVNICEGI